MSLKTNGIGKSALWREEKGKGNEKGETRRQNSFG